MKNKRLIMFIFAALLIITPSYCFADVSNPGVGLAEWIHVNVISLFGAAVAIYGLILLFTRKIVKGIIFICIAALAAVFVFSGPSFFQKISQTIVSWF